MIGKSQRSKPEISKWLGARLLRSLSALLPGVTFALTPRPEQTELKKQKQSLIRTADLNQTSLKKYSPLPKARGYQSKPNGWRAGLKAEKRDKPPIKSAAEEIKRLCRKMDWNYAAGTASLARPPGFACQTGTFSELPRFPAESYSSWVETELI